MIAARVATLLLAVVVSLAAPLARAGSTPVERGYRHRADVDAFIAEMVREHGFARRDLERVFAQAQYKPKIVAAMQRPILAPPKWYEYAPPLLSQERIDGGVAYWRAHADALARAEAQYGVPPEIIVAIVGVETLYGRNTGSYRTIDALSTLAFDYPRRAAFFRGELAEFLLLAREQGFSPLTATGSFAGALGVPQFMPGSVRRFAVDFDGDGKIDLWHSDDDAIGSVANYLARHDWQAGQPVVIPVTLDPSRRDDLVRKLDGGISERRPLAAWIEDGVIVGEAAPDLSPEPLGLLVLEEADTGADRYFLACPDFYVITRYNRSRLYAAAVWSLAEAIKLAR
jgi:membrane-bound lytic murein transglycosylase B